MMMLFRFTICWLLLSSLFPAGSRAALLFGLDFNQDGAYESSWPLSQGDTVNVDVYVSGVPAPGLLSMGFALQYDRSRLQPVQEQTLINSELWMPGIWNDGVTFDNDAGTVTMTGLQKDYPLGPEITGDDLLLGRFTFLCLSQGGSDLLVLPVAAENFDGFVETDGVVLDGDLGTGLTVASFYAQADLAVDIQNVPDYVLADGTIQYILTVTNAGPTGAEGVVLPLSQADITNRQYSLDGGVTWHDRFGSLSLGFLAAGNTLAIYLRGDLSAGAPGLFGITESINAVTPDPVPDNNSSTRTTLAVLRGDLDNSNQVDLNDAIIALQVLVAIAPGNLFLQADTNADNRVEIGDLLFILHFLAGLRN